MQKQAFALQNTMLNAICIGLGLFAPIGEIGQIITSGNEIVVSYEYGASARQRCYLPSSLATSFELISFSKNELSINAVRAAEKVRFRLFKRLNLTAGIGWYFIEVETSPPRRDPDTAGQNFASPPSIEKDRGSCSFVGLWLPFYIGEKGLLTYEALYSTVPRGISMNLNLGFRL